MGALKLTYYETKNPLKVVYSKTLEEQKSVQRFLSVDPMAEKYPNMGGVVYCYNNPIRFIDPDGMLAGDYYNTDGEHLGNDDIVDDKVYAAKSVTKDDKGIVTSAEDKKDLGITHTEFATSANVVKHESSGDKTESLWIAHTANNAKDDNDVDWKKQNSTLNDQLTDPSYSTTPASARTPLGADVKSASANGARAAVIDVMLGNADPTGGAVLWDGSDFLGKGASHNKFKEYTSVNINAGHLQSYALGTKNKSIASTFWAEVVFKTSFNSVGSGKYHSLHSAGSPGNGSTIFWKIGSK